MISGADSRIWETFLRDIANASTELSSTSPLWFRGVTREEYVCTPSLLRFSNGKAKEGMLFQRFEQLARGVRQQSRSLNTDWEVLYEMQHYGIPTRLLDWTEIFGIALFFACLGPNDDDGFIYILAPDKLNRKQGKNELIGRWDQDAFGYKQYYIDARPLRPPLPLAINPEHTNTRLAAQRGRFTIHGEGEVSLDEAAADCIRKIRLKRQAKPVAKQYLAMFGIDEFDIFPDLQGASMFLPKICGLQ